MQKKKYRQKAKQDMNRTYMNQQATMIRSSRNTTSNNPYSYSDDQIQIQQFDTKQYSKKLQLTPKQWIILGLCKLIPHKDTTIKINIIKNIVSGPKLNVETFCTKAHTLIQRMVFKIIKLKKEIPVEEFHDLPEEWEAQVFTKMSIKVVCRKIQEKYKLDGFINEELDVILSRDGVNDFTRFVKVKKECFDQLHQEILKVNKRYPNVVETKSTSMILADLDLSLIKQAKIQTGSSNIDKIQRRNIPDQTFQEYSQNSREEKKYQNKSKNIKKEEQTKSKKEKSNFDDFLNDSHQSQKDSSSDKKKQSQDEDDGFQIVSSKKKFRKEQRNAREDSQQQMPRRSRRQGAQQEPKRGNRQRYVREGAQQLSSRRGNRQRKDKIILFCEFYPETYLDKQDLYQWIKRNKTLKINQLQLTNKYSQQDECTLVQVKYSTTNHDQNKIYQLDIYFHFIQVFIMDQQQSLRDKIIQKFVSNNTWMKIQYQKIFSRHNHPTKHQLIQIVKKNNTAQHKFKKQYHQIHVLYLCGLMTEIKEIIGNIKIFIQSEMNKSKRYEIILKYEKLEYFCRDNEVKELVKGCIKEYFKGKQSMYKLFNVKDMNSSIIVDIEAYNVPVKEFDVVEEKIKNQLYNLVDTQEYDEDDYKQYKRVFDSLKTNYLLVENKDKGITLICKRSQLKAQSKQISIAMINSKKAIAKQMTIKKKSYLNMVKDFVQKRKNQEKINITITIQSKQSQFTINIMGQEIIVENIYEQVQQFIENIEGKVYQYNVQFTEDQVDIIQKDKQIQTTVEQTYKINMKFKRNVKLGAIVELHSKDNQNSFTLIFERQFNFFSLQYDSSFFFRDRSQFYTINQKFLLPFKQKTRIPMITSAQYYDKGKKCNFIFQYSATPKQILQINMSQDVKNYTIYCYLPSNQKEAQFFCQQLIKQLIQNPKTNLLYLNKPLKIIIIGKQDTDFQKLIKLKEGKQSQKQKKYRKWLTKEGQTKLFYNQLGNAKIQKAYISNANSIQLSNEDLNLTNLSHRFNFQNNTMTHIQSGTVFPITVHNDKITFVLNGVTKTIPNSEFKKIKFPTKGIFQLSSSKPQNCDLSIGLYKLDFKTMKQINLFSSFQRKLYVQETIKKEYSRFQTQVSYNSYVNKVSFQYVEETRNNLLKAIQYIKDQLDEKIISKIVQLDNEGIMVDLLNEHIENGYESVNLEIASDNKSAVISSYNQRDLDSLIKIVQFLFKTRTNKQDVKYPKQWIAQKNDIESFIVPANTVQFQNIQKAFTSGKITELLRIQNKIVYKRYHQQKLFLKNINGGKQVKQMLLYHGTSKTDPKIIYEDKEDCFNINYSRQTNLLGKGIYFAEKSEYSISYSYKQPNNVLSMLYCEVLVGQSQKCLVQDGDIRDTDYKDQTNKIKYESMTAFLNNSNVFVVYKSKRAYPLYLIKYTR